jgi:hypothetical protein
MQTMRIVVVSFPLEQSGRETIDARCIRVAKNNNGDDQNSSQVDGGRLSNRLSKLIQGEGLEGSGT